MPPSPGTSIESGYNPLDVDSDPESFYKYPRKKFSLGPSSLAPGGDIEVGREARASFKIVDENCDPDACAYKSSESEEIGDNGVIYSFVIRRQHGKPITTINHDVGIKSRELQNIVYLALMSGTLKEHDLTVDLIDLCNALPQLEDSLENLKLLVEFLKQLQEIEHGPYATTHSPDLPAEDSNHLENVVDPLRRFSFILDGVPETKWGINS
ncbi:MAG: hypothetical protein M1839_004454 [Geoglossum umbratile]|nr:MAG: hypothetical protein M1839_004454 [Geoglossum umbratile]